MHEFSLNSLEGWNVSEDRQYQTIGNPLKVLNQFSIKVQLNKNTPVTKTRNKQYKLSQPLKVRYKINSQEFSLPKIQRQEVKVMSLDMDSFSKKKYRSVRLKKQPHLKNPPQSQILSYSERQFQGDKKMRQISMSFRKNKASLGQKRVYSQYKDKDEMISVTKRCLEDYLMEKDLRTKAFKQKIFLPSFLNSISA